MRRLVDELESAARAELLRVLTRPADVRADAIRQFRERWEGSDFAELLVLLEE